MTLIVLDRNEQQILLEALAAHADTGWHSAGRYGAADGRAASMQLGERLCRTLGLDVKERSWIENEKETKR